MPIRVRVNFFAERPCGGQVAFARGYLFGLLSTLLLNPGLCHAEDVEHTYGAWTLRCQSAASASSEDCIMFQNLVLKTGGQPVLQFAIGRAPGADSPTVLMKLPLGMALPPGVTIQIDNAKPATFPIERCDPNGCQAGMKLREATITQLEHGQRLNITFYDGGRKPIQVPLSLDGFADSFKALLGPHR